MCMCARTTAQAGGRMHACMHACVCARVSECVCVCVCTDSCFRTAQDHHVYKGINGDTGGGGRVAEVDDGGFRGAVGMGERNVEYRGGVNKLSRIGAVPALPSCLASLPLL